MAKGYVVVVARRADNDALARYRELSAQAVAEHGGRFLVRGGRFEVLEGAWQPVRVVVVEFPSYDAAKAFYDSETYRQARAAREGVAEYDMLVVEGLA
ncbi:DUF1330 domain-containing protein [Hydrogenophilus thermoluteolus]|jgi:uncharacterized protein (DUF1330 family)|uniref:DUF1330 domain-containing protein n=1 Tax=Hydrogenophilus thermoluteolus TaxID=297 RepID=A0A2Z6DZS7_HYDTE|nr:DUF1330 domain-containing protein [Hydrogenophilus thermoluteolus]MBW7656995.1 DUF1330 domain-containing protein [Hydrogenophilus thermoluteolus]BBD77839.1 DUF1330 domain-containing protein [Hydrogenophilus thermoluteolus]GLW61667.1 hypothetical protein Hthe01_20160 [Hydrogenophilus thermoluteolus]